MFNVVDLIEKKYQKQAHTKAEIEYLVNGFVSGEIKDYQMAAWLMAVRFNDLNDQELADLTLAMMNSGEIMDLSDVEGIKVDKHSTGGVGDKISLILGPILAANDVVVAKMSGRGLGHTGGTIDKLESIKGLRTELSQEDFIKQLHEIKLAIIGQNPKLVPADKYMYALRDVTSTVNSIALIASSVMSKKLATGSDVILLDIKVGKGAFMKNQAQAEELAKRMIQIGKLLKKEVRVELTNMDRPLGRSIGNKNEVLEAINTLKGKGVHDINTVVYSSAGQLLLMAKKVDSLTDGISLAQKVIYNGSALKALEKMIKAQGGDWDLINSKNWWNPAHKLEVKADKSGFLVINDALAFGLLAVDLGAGRHKKEDALDFEAGIELNKKTNEVVHQGDVLFTLYSSSKINPEVVKRIENAYTIEQKQSPSALILKSMK
ncbi:thymidine phosphorylase [Mycoplasmopsis agassizii]|uniref:Thymidine phosphorylase n=1 Tax=Mycoplasmopsis agassizii TaxID=33922 RepID=A0ABX4H6H6_9BACT|nr:thymidine phosphorylase [Mycoplasmopsis agassizii]PAF55422.1 thymidine phosphorylase [Mycoplasmopsis agassizii]SMC18387.1 pyrimidine-nucleoside phosphorylase [Mycoplasmopsis agassizii]